MPASRRRKKIKNLPFDDSDDCNSGERELQWIGSQEVAGVCGLWLAMEVAKWLAAVVIGGEGRGWGAEGAATVEDFGIEGKGGEGLGWIGLE
ncbi:unnamed protein product [Linum trigynum]|uniref:Uncharacterized protein n=1 Tax=Linum trigynum TaxID=586398 RepID=A0AAV2FXV9_9ROSI